MHLATEQLSAGLSNRTLPNVLPPALLPPSLRPIPPDPSIYEESNKLIVEIEALSRYVIIIAFNFCSMGFSCSIIVLYLLLIKYSVCF